MWDTRQGGSTEHSRDTLRDTVGMDTRQILDGAGVHSRDTCQMLWGTIPRVACFEGEDVRIMCLYLLE